LRQGIGVDRRGVGKKHIPGQLRTDTQLGAKNLIGRDLSQPLDLLAADFEFAEYRIDDACRAISRMCRMGSATLGDCAVEEASRARHRQQRRNRHPTGGLSKDRYPVRVAPEGFDVVSHPFERRDLIALADIRRGTFEPVRVIGEMQIAENPEPIIYGHEHDLSAAGKRCPFIERLTPGPTGKTAAMNPDHDWPAGGGGGGSSASGGRGSASSGGGSAGGGRGINVQGETVPDTRPGFRRARCRKTRISYGRRGIRYAAKELVTLCLNALDLSMCRCDNDPHIRLPGLRDPQYNSPILAICVPRARSAAELILHQLVYRLQC